jgi:hypothetical protein
MSKAENKSFKHFLITVVMRAYMQDVKVPTNLERLSYFLLAEPAVLTGLFVRGPGAFTTKYRRFLESLTFPSVDKTWQYLDSCSQTHSHPDCHVALKNEHLITLSKIAKLYSKMYLLQWLFNAVWRYAMPRPGKKVKKIDSGIGLSEGDDIKPKSVSVSQQFYKDLKHYLNQVGHSTLFLYLNMTITRIAICTFVRSLDPDDKASKYPLQLYLASMSGAAAIVFETGSRVAMINRMMLTYLIGDLIPGRVAPEHLAVVLLPLMLQGKLTPWVLFSSGISAAMM